MNYMVSAIRSIFENWALILKDTVKLVLQCQ